MEKNKVIEVIEVEDWLIIIATFILFLMFGLNWFFNNNDLIQKEPITIHIKKGMSFHEIADTLHKHRIINSKTAFLAVGKILGAERKIKSGYHRLNYGLSNYDYLNVLVTGKNLSNIYVTIPEGLTLKEISELFEKVFDFKKDDFLRVASDSTLLRKYEVDHINFEGYLMPDTYEFAEFDKPEIVLERLASEFKKFYDEKIKPFEKKVGMNKKQIITLASIVEAETNNFDEMPIIAGVYLNRLKKGMKLQADPTVVYALGERVNRVTYNHLKINSPYNTYLYYDLPPGPINCPGRNALLAVINYEKHNYLYFVASGDGETHKFARNYSEHQKNVIEYRNSKK
ncbi:MAG: endolytic transglycosylase MltG [Ignavibacteria bacterium]|nr:endolytic transglycosylase MltG [Ignavibacteria bacterium]